MPNLPVRDPSTAKLAGVCSALARAWAVDPTLIRVAFVVLGLLTNGFIVAAYFLLWAILPSRGGEAPLHRLVPASRSWSLGTLVAVVLTGTVVLGALGTGSGFGAFAVLALTWLILRFGTSARRGEAVTPASAPLAAPSPTPDTDFGRAALAWQQRLSNLDAGRPLDWEPAPALARAAGLDWTASSPGEAAARRRRGGRAWFGILAALGAAWTGLAAASALGHPVPALAWCAATLGVLGASLVWSSRRRRTIHGRPVLLLPLTVVLAVVTAVGIVPATTPGVPATVVAAFGRAPAGATILPVGEHTLDLTDETVRSTTRSYRLDAGELTLIVPATGNVVVVARAGLGEIGTPSGDQEGFDLTSEWSRTDTADGPTLTIEVSVGLGEIEVRS